jgi:hypothetical protein
VLHVSIHAGKLKDVCPGNRLDWMDIGYSRLAGTANYRVALFRVDRGPQPIRHLRGYPRWSAPVWDLVVRAIALSLSPFGEGREKLPALQEVGKEVETGKRKPRFAYADALCAVVTHKSDYGTADRNVASMQLTYLGGEGMYRATLMEDRRADFAVDMFEYRPKFLMPCDLIARAALMAMTGRRDTLPPRPSFDLPGAHEIGGVPYVTIDLIPEPARTGFLRFMRQMKLKATPSPKGGEGAATEKLYLKFLEKVP